MYKLTTRNVNGKSQHCETMLGCAQLWFTINLFELVIHLIPDIFLANNRIDTSFFGLLRHMKNVVLLFQFPSDSSVH